MEIDRSRRAARAGHEARGAADDLDSIVQRRVDRFVDRLRAEIAFRRHAVVHQVVDDEAARGEDHALGVPGVGVHAGRVVEDVLQRLQVLVLDAFARHDRDRLGVSRSVSGSLAAVLVASAVASTRIVCNVFEPVAGSASAETLVWAASVPVRHAKDSRAVLNRMTNPSVASSHIDKKGMAGGLEP